MCASQALDLADEKGTDVVMVSPDAAPPVVRLIEVSKLKYEQEKAKKEAGRKSRAARCAPSSGAPAQAGAQTRSELVQLIVLAPSCSAGCWLGRAERDTCGQTSHTICRLRTRTEMLTPK